ncbi:MAG: Z1 domain-containing protein [Culicoidibacterales bacterium]
MNQNVKMIIELATTLLKNQEKLIEGQINSTVQLSKTLVEVQNTTTISSDEIEEAIRELETRFSITMDTGVLLEDKAAYENKKWYYNSKVENGTKYWDKYEQYLEKEVGLPTKIINKIDESADDVMDVLGNPKSDYPFSRKGLVIGAVQSGKTSNYIALMNKAADSGYKVIILLTGTLEKLRKQTQMRVDEGFVGRNSKDAKNNNVTSPIGVGNPIYGKEVTNVSPFTTTENDFNTKEALTISSQNGVVVFVIKKNKSVLEKLYCWLQRHNLEKNSQKIQYPLLMIDDEADNASINTNDKESDPTTINKLIRQNLALFSQHSYVGFTATPFANIFIDPKAVGETDDEIGTEDLFPKDFIYLLNQPSNYVGPDAVYREGAKFSYMLKNNDDVEALLPLNHKNGERLDVLPNSLKEAILLFFITNAIRDLRGDQAKHRSMLVHISRFISVQETVKDAIQIYVKKQVQNIKQYGLHPQENKEMQFMHELFEREFKNAAKNTSEAKLFPIKEEWEDVKEILYKSIAPIQVKTVNSGTATKNLNYEEYDDGLRIITVGGFGTMSRNWTKKIKNSYSYR